MYISRMFGLAKQHLCKSDNSQTGHRFSYCGTCKSIGRTYGQQSRLFLNHDVVFLSALLNGYTNETVSVPAYESKSCFSIPKSKQVTLPFQYASSVNVFLASVKILDNVRDSKAAKKLSWQSLKLAYAKPFLQAKNSLQASGLNLKEINALLTTNYENESRNNLSLSAYTQPTATITASIFSHGAILIQAKQDFVDAMAEIGKQLGKLVYLTDARDDIQEDQRQNNFNPILASNQVNLALVQNEIQTSKTGLIAALESLDINESIKQRYLNFFSTLAEGEETEEQRKKKKKQKGISCCDDGCVVHGDPCSKSCCGDCCCNGCCKCFFRCCGDCDCDCG